MLIDICYEAGASGVVDFPTVDSFLQRYRYTKMQRPTQHIVDNFSDDNFLESETKIGIIGIKL